ncbi:MAG TPA: CoA transferase [Dehalococcoidia bacterium]|nr:CoA transferase [Dehalococcoidia bacterium]
MALDQPFAGITVVEFGQFVAVPFCAQLLAEGGAHVIKIESLEGDPVRKLGQLAPGETRVYLSRNRGKHSLPLNLRHPEAAPVIDALLAQADVALMNFRPGLAEQLGLDSTTLRARYPRLIIGEVTPFGRDGPDSDLPGMDIVVQARSGLMVANGRSADDRPVAGDPVSADYMTAMTLAFGVSSALLRRERTGAGGDVHVSLMQSAMTLNNNQMLRVDSVDGPLHDASLSDLETLRGSGDGYAAQRATLPSSRASSMLKVYFRTYSTKDGWLAIACGSPSLRQRFITASGLEDPGLTDDTLANADDHNESLRLTAESVMAGRTTKEWEAILADAGVPASDVKFPPELFADDHPNATGMFHDLDHPILGNVRLLAPPVKLDGDGFRPGPATAPFATEARDILSTLGFDAAQIDALIEAKVSRQD